MCITQLSHKFTYHEASKKFILAGNAVFTVRNENTQNRFTFKMTRKKYQAEHEQPLYWVKVLTRSDNASDDSYMFIGAFSMAKGFTHSLKSHITASATSVKVARYYLNLLFNDTLPTFIYTYHEGYCGRCGRLLTVPESIESGFGPECVKLMAKTIHQPNYSFQF